MDAAVKHRPGIFKQTNKTHKTGRHRSKGIIHKDTKGMFINLLFVTTKYCSFLRRRVPTHVVSETRMTSNNDIVKQ